MLPAEEKHKKSLAHMDPEMAAVVDRLRHSLNTRSMVSKRFTVVATEFGNTVEYQYQNGGRALVEQAFTPGKEKE